MPEGDTIHHAAGRIRAALAGAVPDEISTPQPRHAPERWPERLHGRRVEAVDAYGKHLFLRFAGGLTVHSHLRMTGSWGVYEAGARWRRARRRAWLVVRRGGFEVVEFDGPVLELQSDARLRADPRLQALGQDIIGETFDGPAFLRRLREDDPTRGIGDALLQQRTVAGIGNMWKAESCFAIGVDPFRAVAEVSDAEALALAVFAREHMRVAAESGHAARPRAVYRRAGMRCPRCGGRVRSRGQGDDNRVSYWCPGCQS